MTRPGIAARQILRVIGRFVVGILVVGYSLLDQLLFPLFRPLIGRLSRLRLFEAIGTGIGRLPPYVALLVLGVPFVAIEPLKILALWWLGVGHLVQGLILLIFAHALSILILERVYQAGEKQLMKIGWFKRMMAWVFSLRDKAMAIARATAVWQSSSRAAADLRARFRKLIGGLR
jgi:hypothetical protein